MTDWTTALVVRDRLGQLRHAGGFLDGPIGSGLDPLEVAVFADTFGPMEPILGRTGLPVVTTVGDLTARHIGKRVRVGGVEVVEGELVRIEFRPSRVAMTVVKPDGSRKYPRTGIDSPCEVLP